MSRMVDACRAQSVPEPEYEVNGGFVRIVFRRATKGDDSVNEGVNGYVNGYVNGEVRRTYNVKRSGPARGLK